MVIAVISGRLGAQAYDFSRYHDYSDVERVLKQIERSHSRQSRLISAGRSIQGRDLWVLEISDRSNGKPEEKPALFVCGGLHGDEPVGSEAALYTAWSLLNGKDDAAFDAILESRTFYICPVVNPDGCDATVKHPGRPHVRNVRPADDDGDGKKDEDPPDDIDRDGTISMMRIRDEEGMFRISPADPRIMLPVSDSTTREERFRILVEGIDDDRDGEYNEDGLGGVDLDHNFPSGWKMEFEEPGSGMYPGSEPESEAIIRFLVEHPNITIVVAYRSGEHVLYRPFDHLPDKEVPAVDMHVYKRFAEIGKTILGVGMKSGYPGDGLNSKSDAKPKEHRPESLAVGSALLSAEPKTKPDIRWGTFIDWVYKDVNVYGLSPSLWTVPAEYIQNDTLTDHGTRKLHAWLKFFEKEWDGAGFIDWKKITHPQLGAVEIGGWSTFHLNNPPPGERLRILCEHQSEFIRELGRWTPQITVRSIEINPVQILKEPTTAVASVDDRGRIIITKRQTKIASDAVLAEVKITVENVGRLGTRTALGAETRYSHQPPRSVLAALESRDGNIEIMTVPRVLRLGLIEGTETKDTAKANKKSAKENGKKDEHEEPHIKSGKWLIRMVGSGELILRVISEKGGTLVTRIPVRF